ncbi:MAG: PhnD/SsuA/transferrin family substrate-binding protein [Acidimicrobiia bacterium]|nr:PhnD/SsuA/transferrin family substrate-binding protein [Acidimicrobiia bacterium]
MTIRKLFALFAVLALLMAACGDSDDTADETTAAPTTTTAAPTTEAPTTTTAAPTTTEAPAPQIGTAENPIGVLFVPSVSAEEIIAGGELLDQVLTDATGLEFDVGVGSSYAATIEEMCASRDRTIGFIPANGYVLASDLCDVEMALKSKRFGYFEYWTQFIVQRDSGIETIDDLAGKKWAYPEAISTSGFLVPTALFNSLGLEVGDSFEAGGHSATARAVYNGEADFGTTFYSPYISVDGVSQWDNDPANADVTNPDDCYIVAADQAEGKFGEGDLVCGDVEVRDARRNIREEAPDVVAKVKIIGLSDPIPNDGMAFSPDFPTDLKDMIVQAMLDYAENDPDGFATAFDAYSWDNVAPTNDAEFDSIRALLQGLGYTLDDF